MGSHVREFVRQCLHCVDTRAGEIVPRPYGDTVHGTAPGEVVHFDFLYVGSSGPEGSEGLPEEDGFRYILDVMDADSLRAKVRQVVDEQERFCKDVQAAVAASRDTKRKIAHGKAAVSYTHLTLPTILLV